MGWVGGVGSTLRKEISAFLIADSDSSAIQVESSKGEGENFYTSFLVGLVRGLSDDARLKGPTRGGLGDHPPGVPRGRLPYLNWGGLDLPVYGFG